MMSSTKQIASVLVLMLALYGLLSAQSTQLTFQGSLNNSSVPANGNYDFEFVLYDALSAGNQIGSVQIRNNVVVANGVFAVKLDFGASFPGAARYLEIRVKPAGQPGITVLAPRQPLDSSPYAIKSLNSDVATNTTQLGGVAADQFVVTTDPRMTDARTPAPGSANYIWNQNKVLQPSSSFVISGNGFIGGTLEASVVSAATTGGTTAVSGVASAATGPTFGGNFISSSTSGIGVRGYSTAGSGSAIGVYGVSDSSSGRGVFGRATTSTGTTFGGEFRSDSTSGRGVFGIAQSDTGVNYGVYGQSNSSSGTGVYGFVLDSNGVVSGVRGVTHSSAGRGIFGTANALSGTTYGGRFENDSTSGRGVFGWATTSTGTTYGGEFRSDSSSGRGVVGNATANTGTTYGGRFESESTQGTAVFGLASASTGITVGGYFETNSSSSSARGVFGLASAATAEQTFGGYFESNSTSGVGVRGITLADFGSTIGGYFSSSSTDGRGVFGATSAIEGTTYGVWGQTDSTSGRGVYGYARANSGTTYGVYGDTDSPNGYAGYFTGPAGSQNYFQRSVGIGVTSPSFQLHLSLDSAAKPTSNTWTISSDRRLKKNIQTIDGALDKLMQLRGVTYQWKNPASQGDMAGTYTGMIAQDVEKVFPEWVREGPDGFKTLTVIGFEGIVVESLREIRAEKNVQIEQLRAENDLEIAQLRTTIEAQRKLIDALKKLVCVQNATADVCKEENWRTK